MAERIDELGQVIEDVVGRPLDQLTAKEASAIAKRLRAIAELPAQSPSDQHLAHHLRSVAEILERGGAG